MKIILIINISLTILLYPIFLYAGLSVDPIAAEVIFMPGKENIQFFQLKNTGINTILVKTEISPMVKGDDVTKWLTVSSEPFKIEPDTEYNFTYLVHPPEDANSELRCRLFFIADEIDEKGNYKSQIGIRMGIPIYVISKGKEVLDANIKSGRLIYSVEKHKLSVKIEIENRSNVHIRPIVDIIVIDNKNKEILRFRVPYGFAVQKEENRYMEIEENMELNAGKYKALANMDYGNLCGENDKNVNKKFSFKVR